MSGFLGGSATSPGISQAIAPKLVNGSILTELMRLQFKNKDCKEAGDFKDLFFQQFDVDKIIFRIIMYLNIILKIPDQASIAGFCTRLLECVSYCKQTEA